MKVLILVPDLRNQGGVANYYRSLSLNEQSNIDYIYINDVAVINYNYSKHIKIIKRTYTQTLIFFKFIIEAHKYQLIHINPSLNRNSFFRDMIFILLSKLMRKRILIFFRGWENSFERKIKDIRILSFLFKCSYGTADCYIVLGKVFKNKLENFGIDAQKRIYIETTIADDKYINELDIERKIQSYNNEVNFLFLSRILKEKGIYIAIDAFIECKKHINSRKIRLYIAGDGKELGNVKAYVINNGFTDIEFVGYVAEQNKKDILLKSHIMIFPTYYGEGLPNCILEGMLYGMPIISAVNGAISDIVEEKLNGFLNANNDSDAYASLCVELIENRELYGDIARRNILKAKNMYTRDVVRKRILAIYDSIGNEYGM